MALASRIPRNGHRGGHPWGLQGMANLILVLEAHATAHSTAPGARLQDGLDRPGDYDVNGWPHTIFDPERLSPTGVERDFRAQVTGRCTRATGARPRWWGPPGRSRHPALEGRVTLVTLVTLSDPPL